MSWETDLIHMGPGKAYALPYMTTEYLVQMGYRRSTGWPVGQVADYRRALPDGRGIHVRVYQNGSMTGHIDRRDPSVDPIGHLVLDAPIQTAVVGAGLLAILGAIAG